MIDDLKQRARELGLWNMFLPKNHYSNLAEYDTYGGAGGFSNVEYGLMAELLGRSGVASEACNCAAPDTGNMEVIARYGSKEHKEKWLKPLVSSRRKICVEMVADECESWLARFDLASS